MARVLAGRWSAAAILLIAMLSLSTGPVVAAQSEDEDATPGDLATYEGGAFGFALAYDPEAWEIVDAASDGVEDYAVFSNGPGFVTLTASTAYGGDIAECQEDWVRYLRSSPGIEDFRPLQNEEGDAIASQEEGVAYAGYAFRSADGDEFFYIECLGLVPDEATLAVVVEGFVEDFSALIGASGDLLARLDTSTAAVPEPAGDGTGGAGGAGGDQGEPDETPGTAFADTFDDPAAGYLSTASPDRREARFAYEDGEFAIQTLSDVAGTWQAGVPGSFVDASIAVDVRLAGETTNGMVLLGCRSSGPRSASNEYVLTLEPDAGALALTRWDDGEPTLLAEDVRDDLVQPGDGTNRLELACTGTTIAATVNGEVVFSVEDSTYAAGGFFLGAGVADGEQGAVDARWDNLEVTVATP